MNYERINWENSPSTDTPLDADNLNKMDEGLDTLNREVQKARTDLAKLEESIGALSARMSSFTRLQEGSTTGDAELEDGRIDADGTEYTNIGDAIRSQVGHLSLLETEEKGSLVGAINELAGNAIQVDGTLSIQGAAADAKATGDAVSELNERLEAIEEGGIIGGPGVPITVRRAILALFNSAAYAETGLSDELSIVSTWGNTEVTGIVLSSNAISFDGDGTRTLTARLTPSDTGDLPFWMSSNPTVATVNQEGVVSAIGNGTCVISASVGNVIATCNVTVTGIVNYSITNILDTCSSSNDAGLIVGGRAYSATIIPDTGCTISDEDITVTMGEEILENVVSNGHISIPEVTGDITITAYGLPAYHLLDGSHTFKSTNRVLSTTRYGHIEYTNGSPKNSGTGLYGVVYPLSANNANGTDSNVYRELTDEWFALAPGDVVTIEVSNIKYSVLSGGNKQYTAWLFGVDGADIANTGLNTNHDQTITRTTTITEATTVCGIKNYARNALSYFAFDIKVWVNGVRYV